MLRQFALQQVPTLKDVLPIVVSDENAPKTRIFCKIRMFHIYFCPLFKLFTRFGTQGTALKKINLIIKQNCGFLFGTPGYRVVHHVSV